MSESQDSDSQSIQSKDKSKYDRLKVSNKKKQEASKKSSAIKSGITLIPTKISERSEAGSHQEGQKKKYDLGAFDQMISKKDVATKRSKFTGKLSRENSVVQTRSRMDGNDLNCIDELVEPLSKD